MQWVHCHIVDSFICVTRTEVRLGLFFAIPLYATVLAYVLMIQNRTRTAGDRVLSEFHERTDLLKRKIRLLENILH